MVNDMGPQQRITIKLHTSYMQLIIHRHTIQYDMMQHIYVWPKPDD